MIKILQVLQRLKFRKGLKDQHLGPGFQVKAHHKITYISIGSKYFSPHKTRYHEGWCPANNISVECITN